MFSEMLSEALCQVICTGLAVGLHCLSSHLTFKRTSLRQCVQFWIRLFCPRVTCTKDVISVS